MPKVGGKHFAYTKAGTEAAKKLSKMIGQPVENTASKRKSMAKMAKGGKK